MSPTAHTTLGNACRPKLNSEVHLSYSGGTVVTDSAAAGRIRMKTRVFIIIGTCAILVLSGMLAIYWYYGAFERIKEMALTNGFALSSWQTGIPEMPTETQYYALESWFPAANSVPRKILELSVVFDGTSYFYPNGTRLHYDFEEWEQRLINENQQKYSHQASIEATENTALAGSAVEALLLAVAVTGNHFARRCARSKAAEESAESLGIPVKRSYWKKNLAFAILTLGLVALGTIIGASDLFVLADGSSSDRILSGWKVPQDVSFFPPRLHNNSPINGIQPIIFFYRQLNLRDYLTLAAPLILFCIAVAVNVYKYRKWKNLTASA